MIKKGDAHYTKMKKELLKAGYKKTQADGMLEAARKHAKEKGYVDKMKKQGSKDKMDESKAMKKTGKKYYQTKKDKMDEAKAYEKIKGAVKRK